MAERTDLQQALDAGLASLAAGDSLEQFLAQNPAVAAELRPWLIAAQMAGAGAMPAPVPAAAQAASRAQFLARAAALRTVTPVARRGLWHGQPRLARALAIGLIFVAVFGVGTYGAVTASAQSLPGDALYGVKRTVERTQLFFAPDDQARGRLKTQFDQRRLTEVQAVTEQVRTVRVDFTGTLEALNGAGSDHWSVSGVVVVVGPQVPVHGYVTIGARLQVEGTVNTSGLVQADHITVLPAAPLAAPATALATAAPRGAATLTASPRPVATLTPAPAESVAFSGVLQSIQVGVWQIAGQTVIVDSATEIDDNPLVGQIVSVLVSRRADGALVARRIGLAAGSLPSATQGNPPTDDHGNATPSASHTPEATESDHGGGTPSASHTPEATESDHGGGTPSASHTPEATESDHGGGTPSASPTPEATESDHSGGTPPASNSPGPTESDHGGGTPQTPAPTESDHASGGSSHTPDPTENQGGLSPATILQLY